MKEVVARELLWFFGAALVAVPIAVLFNYMMVKVPLEGASETEQVFEMELFVIGGIIGFIGTYFMRAVMWAAITVLTKG